MVLLNRAKTGNNLKYVIKSMSHYNLKANKK